MAVRRTILVVEDDDATADLYRWVLTSDGFTVAHVRDGVDALRYLEQHRPDLVILDIGLRLLDGRSVGQDIRAHADTRDIPIVVVTGQVEMLDDLDSDCVLRKPVDIERLVATVHDCLRTVEKRR